MAIQYAGKVYSDVMNDGTNTYYSDPECNAKLGMAEKFFIEARTSNVTGTTPTLAIALESSNDNVNWVPRSTVIVATAIASGTTLTGSELGTAAVGGRFQRFTLKLAGTTPNAYVELWVTARNAF